jgi:hypothetical protein
VNRGPSGKLSTFFWPDSDRTPSYRNHGANVRLRSMGSALCQFRPDFYPKSIKFCQGGKSNYHAIVQHLKKHRAPSEHLFADDVFAEFDKHMSISLSRKLAATSTLSSEVSLLSIRFLSSDPPLPADPEPQRRLKFKLRGRGTK